MNIWKTAINIIVITSIMVFSSACKSSHEVYGNAIFSIAKLTLAEKVSKFDCIIIIPGSGCTGCISQAEQYFLQNKCTESVLFVFTNYYSYKNMSLRLGGKDNLLRDNVYMDANNAFYLKEYSEHIYPYIIYIENNAVKTSKPL